ncbi:oxidoreductase UcpA [Abditibacteriota bacterium]|nr:oxidoreductase UcpA [Abditibacteriota bacterium]
MDSELPTPAKAGFSFSKLALFVGAVMLLLRLMRGRAAVDFRGRTILISGGSRGLGLNIARQFAQEGANLVLLARDVDELKDAKKELEGTGVKVLTIVGDVTQKSECENAVKAASERFGSLDALVNNAGVIQIGPLEHMDDDDFKAAIDLHIWGPLHLSRAALPYLKRGRVGRIANIASFGGLVAVPHMAPYAVSKFGLVGLSDAMRHEVAKDGVRVTTVCPGIIRTGSHVQAKFKGHHKAEYRIFKLGAISPLAVNATVAAKLIVDAMRYGDPFLTFPAPIGWAALLYRAFPNLAGTVLAVMTRLMPGPTDHSGDEALSGIQLESGAGNVPLASIADKAVPANNESKA